MLLNSSTSHETNRAQTSNRISFRFAMKIHRISRSERGRMVSGFLVSSPLYLLHAEAAMSQADVLESCERERVDMDGRQVAK